MLPFFMSLMLVLALLFGGTFFSLFLYTRGALGGEIHLRRFRRGYGLRPAFDEATDDHFVAHIDAGDEETSRYARMLFFGVCLFLLIIVLLVAGLLSATIL